MGIEGGNYQEPVKKRPESRMRRIMRAEMKLVEERIIKEHGQKVEAQRKEREKQYDLDSKASQKWMSELQEKIAKERNELKDFISKNKVDTSKNLTTTEDKIPQTELTDLEKKSRENHTYNVGVADELKLDIKDLANINSNGIQFKKPDGSTVTLTFDNAKNQNNSNIPYDRYVSIFYLKNTKDNTTSTITINRKGQLYLNGESKFDSEDEEILINLSSIISEHETYWTNKMNIEKQNTERQEEISYNESNTDQMLDNV